MPIGVLSSYKKSYKIKQVVRLLTKTYHLQKTVINSKFIIYIITTLSFLCKFRKK